MGEKTYFQVSGVIFLAIAVLHLLRILNGWPALIANQVMPIWASWVGVVVALFLAYHALRLAGKT